MNITIILAAGEGTRMKSKKSKVLHKIVNRTLIDYVYDASCDAGSDKTIIIVGKNKIEVEEKFGDKVLYKEQKIGKEYPYGTGYAVQLAVDEIRDDDNFKWGYSFNKRGNSAKVVRRTYCYELKSNCSYGIYQ